MFQNFSEFYRKHKCPECKATNWTYHGHSDDEYYMDPEICKCHACKKRYWMMDEYWVNDFYPSENYEFEGGETLMDVCGAPEADGKPNP